MLALRRDYAAITPPAEPSIASLPNPELLGEGGEHRAERRGYQPVDRLQACLPPHDRLQVHGKRDEVRSRGPEHGVEPGAPD